MEKKLTTQDICKLIEVLFDTSNGICRVLHFNGIGRKHISEYKIHKLVIQELYFVDENSHIGAVSIVYENISELFIDNEQEKSASIIIELLEKLYQKQEQNRNQKSITEILNIIHNDKEEK